MLPPLAAIHLPSCGFHMTILRRLDPPLQWPVLSVGPGFHGKHVAQPWYWFLAEGDFVHGDELSCYYRPCDDIWEVIIRKKRNWGDNDGDWILISILLVYKTCLLNFDA